MANDKPVMCYTATELESMLLSGEYRLRLSLDGIFSLVYKLPGSLARPKDIDQQAPNELLAKGIIVKVMNIRSGFVYKHKDNASRGS